MSTAFRTSQISRTSQTFTCQFDVGIGAMASIPSTLTEAQRKRSAPIKSQIRYAQRHPSYTH